MQSKNPENETDPLDLTAAERSFLRAKPAHIEHAILDSSSINFEILARALKDYFLLKARYENQRKIVSQVSSQNKLLEQNQHKLINERSRYLDLKNQELKAQNRQPNPSEKDKIKLQNYTATIVEIDKKLNDINKKLTKPHPPVNLKQMEEEKIYAYCLCLRLMTTMPTAHIIIKDDNDQNDNEQITIKSDDDWERFKKLNRSKHPLFCFPVLTFMENLEKKLNPNLLADENEQVLTEEMIEIHLNENSNFFSEFAQKQFANKKHKSIEERIQEIKEETKAIEIQQKEALERQRTVDFDAKNTTLQKFLSFFTPKKIGVTIGVILLVGGTLAVLAGIGGILGVGLGAAVISTSAALIAIKAGVVVSTAGVGVMGLFGASYKNSFPKESPGKIASSVKAQLPPTTSVNSDGKDFR